MSKYRYTGPAEVFFPDLHLFVKPGDVVESDEDIRNNDFVPVRETKPERPAKEF